MRRFPVKYTGFVVMILAIAATQGLAQEKATKSAKPATAGQSPAGKKAPPKTAAKKLPPLPKIDVAALKAENPTNMHRLTKDFEIWFDLKQKLIVVGGEVCLREGPLEMFACPRGTKEHESVVSLNCKSRFVHAALLAVEAKPGKPVTFRPKYRAATGDIIDVLVYWQDREGKHHLVRAQQWVRDIKAKGPMTHDWVFAGSGFSTDEETKQRRYYADAGDLVCVSNFPTATLDVTAKSSQATADLMFEAYTEKIPPRGTKVRVLFMPRREISKASDRKKPGKTG